MGTDFPVLQKVSETEPGEADIEHAISSSKDELRFLLHDSLGFEHGENSTVEAARRFIQRRNQEPQMKEKIHVIWYARSSQQFRRTIWIHPQVVCWCSYHGCPFDRNQR